MRRFRWGIAGIALLATLLQMPASAGAGHDHTGPDRIDLPNGWQPEGITTDGRFLYVGSIAGGGIWRADSKTGAGELLAPGVDGRVAAGVEYDRRRDLLWVAGASNAEVRVYKARTGKLLKTYAFPSNTPRFLNDLVVTCRGVFATDSFNQELAVVPLKGKHGHHHGCSSGHRHHGIHAARQGPAWLPPSSAAKVLSLTGDLVYTDGFNLNGIVKSAGRLLAVQTNTGLLFRIDPWNGRTKAVDLDGATLVNGDGLELDEDTLYVVLNFDNVIAVVDLKHDLLGGKIEAQLTDPGLDVPATVALARDSLWAVNARFLTPPTPDTTYWITRLDEFDDD